MDMRTHYIKAVLLGVLVTQALGQSFEFANTSVTANSPDSSVEVLGSPIGTDVHDYDESLALTELKSQSGTALGLYTQSLLAQNLSVFGQAVLLPAGLFRSHPCQVVYLGSPDWASIKLDVSYISGLDDACPPGQQPQAFYAYVDGYNVPQWASGVTLSSSQAPWAAVVADPDGSGSQDSGKVAGVANTTPPPQPPAASGVQTALAASPPASQQRRRLEEAAQRPVGLWARVRRALGVSDTTAVGSGVTSMLSGDRLTFHSAYDRIRGQSLATQELLARGKDVAPGPEGLLSVPVMASTRSSDSLVASPSTYTEGALLAGGQGGMSTMSDQARVYWAPEEECMSFRTGAGAGGRPQAAGDRAGMSLSGANSQDSCFVSQLVVYVYNPCISNSSDSSGNGTGTGGNSGYAAAAANGSMFAGGNVSATQRQVLAMLDSELASNTSGYAVNRSRGYAQVTVLYTPYDRCVRQGVDMLADVSLQVVLFSVLAFGWMLLFLLLPSMWRLFLEFPARVLVYGVSKLRGRDSALKPMKPGLHSHKTGSRWRLGRVADALLGPLLRLRKSLLYAVVTVHYADGQSRWLQVSVISNVALCIAMAVYSPKLAPPLEHFVPPLALQITKTSDALGTLTYFFTIVLFSSFMGTLGYLSMLANYNSPVNQYYRVQCFLSASFMILQDLLILLQVVSMLAEWRYLRPSWPYLPMIAFQLANLLAANVLQVIIFSKRHDEHDKNVYAAYVAAREHRANGDEDAAAPAPKRSAGPSAGTQLAAGDSSDEESSTVGEEGVLPVVEHREDRQRRASREVGAGDRGNAYIDVRRHRQQQSHQQERRQQRRSEAADEGCDDANHDAAPDGPSAARRPRSLRREQESHDVPVNGSAAPKAGAVQLASLGSPGTGGRSPGVRAASRPQRRRLLDDGDDGPGPGPVAEGLEEGSEGSDTEFIALVPKGRRHRGVNGVTDTAAGQRRRGGTRPRQTAPDICDPVNQGEHSATRPDVSSDESQGTALLGGSTLGARARSAANVRVKARAALDSRPGGLSKPAKLAAVDEPASTDALLPKETKRTAHKARAPKKGNARASLAADAAGGEGLLGKVRHAGRDLWENIRESSDFRYPAWLLAALLVSGYMVVFHYARGLEWSGAIKNCILDPSECATNTLGRYLKFASRLFSRRQQSQLLDSLDMLLGTQGEVTDMVGRVADTNATAALVNSTTASLVSQMTANLSSNLNDTLGGVVLGALQQSLATAGLGGATDASGLAASLTPSLTEALQARLADALAGEQLNSLLAQQASAAVTRVVQQQAGLQTATAGVLNATVTQLYRTVNLTTGFLNRTMAVEEQVRVWQEGLSSRFAWSSVVGFTLGLMLGLSTLVQTAMSFRRAVREARRMRAARRMLARLVASTGAGGDGAGDLLRAGEDTLLANRALKMDVSYVVFFFGVLMSTAVIQLYMVGVLLSVVLAVLTHPWTWRFLLPRYWLYLAAILGVIVTNKYILIGYVGSAFLTNGDHIYRPAAWLAFSFIMSITNLVIGLLLAVYRIALLLLTTVLSLGKLEVTIFTFFSYLDLPHNSFLAGLHLHEAMANFHDPIYLPGPRGAAHRRWRKLRDTVRTLTAEEFRRYATLGRPKEVQEAVDHVVVNMHAAKALAASSIALDRGSQPQVDSSGRPSLRTTSSMSGVPVLVEARTSRSRGVVPQASRFANGPDVPVPQEQPGRGTERAGSRGRQTEAAVPGGQLGRQGSARPTMPPAAASARRHQLGNARESRYRPVPESADEEEPPRVARSRGCAGAGARPQGRARRLYDGSEEEGVSEGNQLLADSSTRVGAGTGYGHRARAVDSPDELL